MKRGALVRLVWSKSLGGKNDWQSSLFLLAFSHFSPIMHFVAIINAGYRCTMKHSTLSKLSVRHHSITRHFASSLFHSLPHASIHRPCHPYRPYHAPLLPQMLIRTAAARGDDDIELAVFRFTLGIPGFDDSLIPRVVGLLGSFLILINHILSPQPVSDPQTRTEAIGAFLSAVAIAAPTLQKRLEELQPNKGRKAPATSVDGASNVFAIDKSVSENIQQELAWSSYALLKNANICGMCILWQGRALLCRGFLGSSLSSSILNTITTRDGGDTILQTATASWVPYSEDGSMISTGDGCGVEITAEYFETRGQILRNISLQQCSILPTGAQSAYIISLGGCSNYMVLVSERERSMSKKERLWAQGIASKLYQTLSSTIDII